jgi:hypothetical protein
VVIHIADIAASVNGQALAACGAWFSEGCGGLHGAALPSHHLYMHPQAAECAARSVIVYDPAAGKVNDSKLPTCMVFGVL